MLNTITLCQFEQIDGIRNQMLRAEAGLPRSLVTIPAHAYPNAQTVVRCEGRLFDAFVDLLGYEAAADIGDVGAYADELITECLIGKVEVIDEVAA